MKRIKIICAFLLIAAFFGFLGLLMGPKNNPGNRQFVKANPNLNQNETIAEK